MLLLRLRAAAILAAGLLLLAGCDRRPERAERQGAAGGWQIADALRGPDAPASPTTPASPASPAAAGRLAAGAAATSGPASEGYSYALEPRPLTFPADHGPHPDFRTEWWYYTGNLESADGRRFGFQLTFFRVALAPPPVAAPALPARTSAWATRQVYFAHFALTDAAAGTFHAAEHWERGAAGLAGASADPFRVWVGDWSATATPAGGASPPPRPPAVAFPALPARAALPAPPATNTAPAPPATATLPAPPAAATLPAPPATDAGTPPMRLTAHDGAIGLDLVLASRLPPVLQGDHGLSAKSAAPGNASYYYSLPRLSAAGSLRLADGMTVQVHGSAWMDREWSTSALAPEEVGWDWFALQLDDGWELMLYRLRLRSPAQSTLRSQAAPPAQPAQAAQPTQPAPPAQPVEVSIDPASRLTLIAPDGATTVLPPGAWSLAPTASWTSPATGTRYPSDWRLTLRDPSTRAARAAPVAAPLLDLTVRPILPAQELNLSFRYWEGAVDVAGRHAGRPAHGRGYVELTGYDAAATPPAAGRRPGTAP